MLPSLLVSLGQTLLFECVIAFFWRVRGRDLLVIVLMNVLTNPLVVLWFHTFFSCGFFINTLLPEAAAMVAEAAIMVRFGRNISSPILLSICINVFSYSLGLLILLFF